MKVEGVWAFDVSGEQSISLSRGCFVECDDKNGRPVCDERLSVLSLQRAVGAESIREVQREVVLEEDGQRGLGITCIECEAIATLGLLRCVTTTAGDACGERNGEDVWEELQRGFLRKRRNEMSKKRKAVSHLSEIV